MFSAGAVWVTHHLAMESLWQTEPECWAPGASGTTGMTGGRGRAQCVGAVVTCMIAPRGEEKEESMGLLSCSRSDIAITSRSKRLQEEKEPQDGLL